MTNASSYSSFVIQTTESHLLILPENQEDIRDIQKFLYYILPMYYEIKTKKYISISEEKHRLQIDYIVKQKETEINQKETEIKQLQEKIIMLEYQNKNEKESIKQNIESVYQTETQLRLELMMNEKNKEIELLKQKLHYTCMNLDLQNTIKAHFEDKHFTTAEKGKIGEEFIMNELEKLTMFETDSMINNVSGKSESGDIFLKLKTLKCCIEVKNHTVDIRQAQIDKFIRDMGDVRFNCGIFISLYTPVVKNANIHNFEIKIIQNKPCIFLINFHQHPDNLYLSIKTLLFLLQNRIQNDTQDYIEKLNKTIQNFNKLTENFNVIEKSVKQSHIIIQNELIDIYKLLEIEQHKEFKCTICSRIYKTSKTLEKHMNDKH